MVKLDPKSMAGKPLVVNERTELLVIGAGPAGLACALEAARLGQKVMLVDENPVPAEMMGDDVPLQFGGRASGAARNRRAMLDAMIDSDPDIAVAYEAGIDVRLGTACWGVYAPGRNATWLPGPVAGLMTDSTSTMVGADRIVVATGRRDMGLAFAGWERPGVMGATAAMRLLRFGALDASDVVLLGSSAEALQAALALRAGGRNIVAMVEQAAGPVGPPEMVAELAAGGTTLLYGHVLRRAEGEGTVSVAVAVPIDAEGRPAGAEIRLACDTIVLGIGFVPLIELLDAAGCRVGFSGERGGIVPVLDGAGRTSVPGVFAVGDCAGIWPEKTRDPAIARAEGQRAARDAGETAPAPPVPGYDLASYRTDWVRASVVGAEGEPHVCQCEEVTAREILEVRPPRYLGWADDRRNDRDLRAMLGNGPPNPDQVKRLTRAGMGLCQGRRCREQVAALLALGAGVPLDQVPPATHRAPVRPIPLALAAVAREEGDMAEHWDTWFGMPAQYLAPGDAIIPYTAAARGADDGAASE